MKSIRHANPTAHKKMPKQPSTSPQTTRDPLANATVLLVLTTLFWGGNAVAGKFAVGEVSPLVLTASRWMIAVVLLSIIARRHLIRDWPVIRQHLPYLCALGAFGFAAFNATLYTSLKYTTAINVTILQAAMPMIIFALNFLIFRTRLHWAQALGYTVTLTGVLITASAGDLASLADLTINRGDVIMMIGAVIYGGYSVALRSRPELHWLSFITVLVAAAAAASIIFASTEVINGTVIWPTSITAWSVILYTVVFPSVMGQAMFARGVELIGSNRAGLFMNLVPIFGSILAVLLLGEVFQAYHALALALVVGGIVVAQTLTPRGF